MRIATLSVGQRTTILLVGGLVGAAGEGIFYQFAHPAALVFFGGMMGMGPLLSWDERNKAQQPTVEEIVALPRPVGPTPLMPPMPPYQTERRRWDEHP